MRGAISGVLGAYLVLFPSNRVLVWIVRFPVCVPAIVAIGLWIAFQLVASIGAGVVSVEVVGGVAYLAHFGVRHRCWRDSCCGPSRLGGPRDRDER